MRLISSSFACAALAAFSFAGSAIAQNAWVRKDVPSPRENRNVVYDPVRHRAVMFGGLEASATKLDDTWEWEGERWTERSPATRPPARRNHTLVWDGNRNTVLMFGGRGDSDWLNDTWEWDGLDWHLISPATSPPKRSDHAMAWDPLRQRAVLFGGSGNNSWNDTWEWDGTDWLQLNPAVKPGSSSQHAMVFDGNLGKTLLVRSGQTWTWDGTTWTNLNPTPRPSSLVHEALSWDPVRSRVVLFGGVDFVSQVIGNNSNRTWEWDGVSWTQQLPATRPTPRDASSLFFDTAHGALVLFGGVYRSAWLHYSDTWRWNGTTWTEISHGVAPPGIAPPALAFDAARGETVLFPGSAFGSGTGNSEETWTWNGLAWTRHSQAPRPLLRYNHALAYDAGRARVVMFGGQQDLFSKFDETWEWDGTAWLKRTPVHFPAARGSHAMAYDAARNVVVLFGGEDNFGATADTWEWDGTDWLQRTPATTPPQRQAHAMAYDPSRQVVVMFGGLFAGGYYDTWEWNGTDWTQRAPATSPTVYGGSMAWDAGRGRIVLFGGVGASGIVSELWEWDGVTWTQAVAPDPSPRAGAGVTYDTARQRLVLFGGRPPGPQTFFADVWEYGALVPAANTTIGQACAGPLVPELIGYGRPTLGDAAFGFDLLHGAPSAAALFGVAVFGGPLPLGPCNVYLSSPIVAVPAATNAQGFAHLTVSLPLVPEFAGIDLFGQGFVLDATAPIGVALTAGLRCTLGE